VKRTFTPALFILVLFQLAHAQAIEPSIGAGLIGLDATHPAVAGSVRVSVLGRLSFDPEILHVRGSNAVGTKTRIWQFGPALAYSFRRGDVSPYIIGGPHFGRISRTFNCQFPSRCVAPSSSFSWTSGSAGAGIRLRSAKFFVSPEVRAIGDKDGIYFRGMVSIGYTP
jgi:hypothetical protein